MSHRQAFDRDGTLIVRSVGNPDPIHMSEKVADSDFGPAGGPNSSVLSSRSSLVAKGPADPGPVDYKPHSGSIPSLSLTARLSLCLNPRYRSVV